jgi:hypothetical protein
MARQHLLFCLTFCSFLLFQFEGHEQLLGIHYDSSLNEESLLDAQGQQLMKIKYENGILPTSWKVAAAAGREGAQNANCTVTYDR